ncbi:MAG TPA: hypothetical protein VGY77_05570, partial [Gemmataceae bacterium]|nr:hypothetical protein [Gemmataceae bacterium]
MATITGNSLLRQLEGKPAGLLKIGLFILLIISTFPNFLPRSRDSGLDQSWVIGLNEAAARGMIFGKEIIFTYGPLGFIDAPIDTGANVTIAAYFRFAIFFLFLLSIALIVFPSTSLVVSSLYILVFIALTFLGTRFYLLIELHLLLAVLGFLVFSQLRQSMLWAIPAAALAGLALLVKFSIGMACASSFGIWAVVTLAQNPSMKTFFELSFLSLVFLAFFIGLFSLFGGPPATLIDYVRYSMVISRGYSSQMSGAPFGNIFDLILAIFQIALLGTLVLSGAPSNRRYLILPILLAPSLFFLFKGGFVRYDRFHAEDYFTVIPAMAGFFLLIAKERWEKIAGSIMVCAVLMLSFVWHFSLFPSFSNPVANGYHRIRDLAQWSSGRERIRNQDADVIKQQKLPSPILAKIGTQRVDAYPWDISIPLANSLNWNPR